MASSIWNDFLAPSDDSEDGPALAAEGDFGLENDPNATTLLAEVTAVTVGFCLSVVSMSWGVEIKTVQQSRMRLRCARPYGLLRPACFFCFVL